jgi:uncharacterized SAM-binding protein YcdF (DUF218 family)
MFYVLSKTLDLAVSPIVWAMVLVFLGRPRKKRPKTKRALSWVAIGMLYLFSIEPVANQLERSLEASAKDTTSASTTYDAVVLLGGVVDDAGMDAFDGAPPAYNDNVERLLVTFDLLRKGRARYAIVSGGTGGIVQRGDVSEAHVLGDQLVAWGIEQERILLEDRARNTRENAIFSKKILDERKLKKVILVTSAFHMQRAAGCFRAENIAFDTLPVDYRAYDTRKRSGSWLPRPDAFVVSSRAIREWTGRAVYRLRGFAR